MVSVRAQGDLGVNAWPASLIHMRVLLGRELIAVERRGGVGAPRYVQMVAGLDASVGGERRPAGLVMTEGLAEGVEDGGQLYFCMVDRFLVRARIRAVVEGDGGGTGTLCGLGRVVLGGEETL